MATQNQLAAIKKSLEDSVGRRVRVKANRGRRRVVEREGILEKTYPSIFVIRLSEKRAMGRRVSYSYSDILTETVQITFLEDHDKSPLTRQSAN